MKKFVLTVLTVLTCGALQALPAGNPADASLYTNSFWFGDSCCETYDSCDPCGNWCDWSSWCDWFDLRLGFYGDYVYNRHLKSKGGVGLGEPGTVEQTTLSTNAGLIALSFCDRFEAFATVGVTNFHLKNNSFLWGDRAVANQVMSELAFDPSMSYSGGLRATIWQCDCFYVGAEAQYFYSNTSVNWFLPYDTGALTYFNNNRSANYQEWQVAIGAAYRFENCANFAFIPYANVEVSGVNWNLRKQFVDGSATLDLQTLVEDKIVGWSLGMTALLCDLIGVTVEGRWANEKAVHVNGQLSF